MTITGIPARRTPWLFPLALACVTATLLSVAAALSDPPFENNATGSRSAEERVSPTGGEEDRIAIPAARDRARVLHEVYSATLEVMHHRYFHGERAIVPARAMEDVFSEIEQQSGVAARWISVNMKPMSIDHSPESDFEKNAAKRIAKGEDHLEIIENGYYRRAGAIPLTGGCVGCHGSVLESQSKTPKFAGLIISIPVTED